MGVSIANLFSLPHPLPPYPPLSGFFQQLVPLILSICFLCVAAAILSAYWQFVLLPPALLILLAIVLLDEAGRQHAA